MEKNTVRFPAALKLQLRAMKDIWQCDKLYMIAIICSDAVSAIVPFVPIWFSARLLDELAGERRTDTIWMWVTLTLIVTGLSALLQFCLKRLADARSETAELNRETLFMEKFYNMDFQDMDKQSVHDLRTQIRQDEDWNGLGFEFVVYDFSSCLKSIIGIISAIALTTGLFSAPIPESAEQFRILTSPLFPIALMAIMALISVLSGKLTAQARTLMMERSKLNKLSNLMWTYFSTFGLDGHEMDVRMYEQESIVKHYFKQGLTDSYGIRGPFARLTKGKAGILNGLSDSFPVIFTGSIYVFTCLKALSGAFGVGSVTQYVGAATTLSGNLKRLFDLFAYTKLNAAYLERIYEFLNIPNTMYQGSLTTEKREDREYQIEFRDVSFRYPETDVWALRHVSVSFKIGSRIAVVGENGSGKTTFIKLLCRLYDPQEGEILLNGIDIRKYNYHEYMDLFSVVFQDYKLLSQPLADNVAGSRNYDKERVVKALNDAGFTERLKSLPEGLNTCLYKEYGDHGIEVSGGEAQMIAIARALYKDAPFLILDEPTAALDPIAEAEIYSQLDQIVNDRTAIYISHRLSSCRFCDEILVFDHGHVIQSGKHEELVREQNGKYHELWNVQAQYYAKPEGC